MQNSFGVVDHAHSSRRTDYLYRISLKCLVKNDQGEVLVVKESGSNYWDLPGGGMDHGEDIKTSIAREMNEEVNLAGNFSFKIIDIDEPAYLSAHNFWQCRLIFELHPENLTFSPGEDSDEVAFIDPMLFRNSPAKSERKIYEYVKF